MMRFKKTASAPIKQRHINPTRPANQSNYSYHSNRNNSSLEERNKDQNRVSATSRNHLVVLMALIVLVIGVLGAGLYINGHPKIIVVQSSNLAKLSINYPGYQQAASKAIDSSWLNHLKLTISSPLIANDLEQSFPEIQAAVVSVPLLGVTPTVTIQLKAPQLIYDSGQQYLIDANGQVIGVNNSTSIKLPLIKGSAYSGITRGSQIMSPNYVQFILTVFQTLAIKGISINQAVLKPSAEELDIYPLNVSYFVKFNLHQTDARQQVGTYLATIATLRGENKTPSQYIDVRVDGRAFYK